MAEPGEGFQAQFCTPEELCDRFHSDPANGLTSAHAQQQLLEDGPNQLKETPRPSLFMLFLSQLCGFIIILLIVAALASVAVNATSPKKDDVLSYTTGKAILAIVILNAGIAAYTENQAGGALEALKKLSQPCIWVVRDGKEQEVNTTTIVRGDIILLGVGDVVPADMRLIDATDLKVSEMCFTGEPDDVSKKAKDLSPGTGKGGDSEKLTPENMCFSSCSVTNGNGRGIVTATGMMTRIGDIAKDVGGGGKAKTRLGCLPDMSENQTPLQQNVEKLGQRIGIGAIGVCICVFFVGFFKGKKDPDNPDSPSWLYMVLIAVTLAVAAIPEGIPLCVTISLSIGSTKMVKNHVRVRKIAAVETLGSASVICSDKTGTLTEGKMTMIHMWAAGVKYNISGKGFDPDPEKGKVTRSDTQQEAKADLGVRTALLAALLCCNASISKVIDEVTKLEKWEPKGNSSEAPIVVAAAKVGFDKATTVLEYPKVVEVPFSSSRKMMLTVSSVEGRGEAFCDGGVKLPPGTKHIVVCKGAPNYLLDVCTTVLNESGEAQKLVPDEKAKLMRVIDGYSEQALRVLAIAVHPIGELPFDPNDEEVSTDQKFTACCKDLQLVGFTAAMDPAREGVLQSVHDANGASIRVVMITGDYHKTALAIARNVGILRPEDSDSQAVDCVDLRPDGNYLSQAEIDMLTAKTKCFARAKPTDKMEIIKSFQRQGLVSAMTGDGVNDAPALSQADIGVAMGIQGTEVAKGASEMILTDDNFCSIVKAVEEGRVVYAGIQKFVAFIMSVHIAEVLQIFVCVILNIPVMRTPLQILFLILVTDLPPSVALGMEPGDGNILKLRPRPKEEPIMVGWMWLSSCMNGCILTAVICVVYAISLLNFCEGQLFQSDIMALDNYEEKLANARTVAFISLVFSENIRAYIARSFERPFFVNFLGNPEMQKAIGAAQLALYAAVLLPGFSDAVLGLRGISIGWWGWGVSLIGPVGTMLICEAFKVVTWYQVQSYQERLRLKAEADAEKHRQLVAAQIKTKKPNKDNGLSVKDVSLEFSAKPGKEHEFADAAPGSGAQAGHSRRALAAHWAKAVCWMCAPVPSGP